MEAIFKFFEGIMTAVKTLIDFVISTLADLVYVIGLLGQFVLEIPSYFSWLPSEAVVAVVTLFSIVVIFQILNRK